MINHETLCQQKYGPLKWPIAARVQTERYKSLMTGPKGNSDFRFSETLNVLRGEAEGNIEKEKNWEKSLTQIIWLLSSLHKQAALLLWFVWWYWLFL